MCEDFVTFLISKLSYASCPFRDTASYLSQLIRIHYLANIGKKIFP